MTIDFQRIWMLLDLIIKASQVGINETSHIVTAAKREIADVHNALADAKAAKVEVPAPAEPTPPIESVPRDAAGNVVTGDSSLRRT